MDRVNEDDLEIKLLTTALYELYDLDFRNYSLSSFRRRIESFIKKYEYKTITQLTSDVIHNSSILNTLIEEITVSTTEMFRDPSVYKYLREKVLPYLTSFSHIRIWHAGTSTGEEIFSLAILLKEEGLLDRCTIYATDINESSLLKIQKRVFSINKIKLYTENYQKAGGKNSLSDYYHAKYDSVIFDKNLLQNTTFAVHNLAVDSVFVEAHLILCRNVMIYFNPTLQNRVLSLFSDSLIYGGLLCLGKSESIDFTDVSTKFTAENHSLKIFRKSYYE